MFAQSHCWRTSVRALSLLGISQVRIGAVQNCLLIVQRIHTAHQISSLWASEHYGLLDGMSHRNLRNSHRQISDRYSTQDRKWTVVGQNRFARGRVLPTAERRTNSTVSLLTRECFWNPWMSGADFTSDYFAHFWVTWDFEFVVIISNSKLWSDVKKRNTIWTSNSLAPLNKSMFTHSSYFCLYWMAQLWIWVA